MLNLATFWKKRYQVHSRAFHIWTKDDVRITGTYLDHLNSQTVVIYAHGFMANKDHGRVPRPLSLVRGRQEEAAASVGEARRHGAAAAVDLQVVPGHQQPAGRLGDR